MRGNPANSSCEPHINTYRVPFTASYTYEIMEIIEAPDAVEQFDEKGNVFSVYFIYYSQ